MVGNHSLARAISDAGFGQLVRLMEEKAQRYGRVVHKVDRWFPSSKLCSACGVVQESMPLRIREWRCGCGALHDRDYNAAVNILAAGRAERLNACGAGVSPLARVAVGGEARNTPHPGGAPGEAPRAPRGGGATRPTPPRGHPGTAGGGATQR